MSSVTIGGHTYSDDNNPTTGLGAGGHRMRFIPLVQDIVAVAAEAASAEAFIAGHLVIDPGTYYVIDSGVANAYVLNIILNNYVQGMAISFKATNANTGASTLKVGTLAVVPIKKNKDVALDLGDIKAGQVVTVIYDGATFQVQSQLGLEAKVQVEHNSNGTHKAIIQKALNVKIVPNSTVNILDIFTLSGGNVPNADNIWVFQINTGNGLVPNTRAGSYLTGNGRFTFLDANNYGDAVSANNSRYIFYLYGIYDGTGVVLALSRYTGFERVPTTTTISDPDFFKLEDGSTYIRDSAHSCECYGHVWLSFYTTNTPDWTILTTAGLEPRVLFQPAIDYGGTLNLATTNISGSNIAVYSVVNVVVKQSGIYEVSGSVRGSVDGGTYTQLNSFIKIGSATYGSATAIAMAGGEFSGSGFYQSATINPRRVYGVAGDTIHLGASIAGSSGNRNICGDNGYVGATSLTFKRVG